MLGTLSLGTHSGGHARWFSQLRKTRRKARQVPLQCDSQVPQIGSLSQKSPENRIKPETDLGNDARRSNAAHVQIVCICSRFSLDAQRLIETAHRFLSSCTRIHTNVRVCMTRCLAQIHMRRYHVQQTCPLMDGESCGHSAHGWGVLRTQKRMQVCIHSIWNDVL